MARTDGARAARHRPARAGRLLAPRSPPACSPAGCSASAPRPRPSARPPGASVSGRADHLRDRQAGHRLPAGPGRAVERQATRGSGSPSIYLPDDADEQHAQLVANLQATAASTT